MRTLILSIALSLFAGLPARAQVQMTRIPIEHEGVMVTVEMPRKWADSEFGYRPVPLDLKTRMGTSGEFGICRKRLEWNRGFLKGPLGYLNVDITLQSPALLHGLRSEESERMRMIDELKRTANFSRPADLFSYLTLTWIQKESRPKYRLSYVNREGTVWLRIIEQSDLWNGIPDSESWFIGISTDMFVRIDFAAIRIFDGPKGSAWQKSALYWQNKMIESLTVTGLKQDLTGVESVETWRFPDALEYAPELIK